MIKEKESPKNWLINDTFYLKITNNEMYNGKYLIFNKVGERKSAGKTPFPVFRAKITNDERLPKTKEELEKLEYVITRLTLWEERFIPYSSRSKEQLEQEKEEKSKTAFYPDEFGNLNNYLFSLMLVRKSKVPSDLKYLGNFELTPPKDEYIPFTEFNINLFLPEKLQKGIIKGYELYNKRKSLLYDMGYSNKIRNEAKLSIDVLEECIINELKF